MNFLPVELVTHLFNYIPISERLKSRSLCTSIKDAIKFTDQELLRSKINKIKEEVGLYEMRNIILENDIKVQKEELRKIENFFYDNQKANLIQQVINIKIICSIIEYVPFLYKKLKRYIELNETLYLLSRTIAENEDLIYKKYFLNIQRDLKSKLYDYKLTYYNNENIEFLYSLHGGKEKFEKLPKIEQDAICDKKDFVKIKIFKDFYGRQFNYLCLYKKTEGKTLYQAIENLGTFSFLYQGDKNKYQNSRHDDFLFKPTGLQAEPECFLTIIQPLLIGPRDYLEQALNFRFKIETKDNTYHYDFKKETIISIFNELLKS